jgi:EAL domain-containing protein (putative c-di-GMP-specific phosphodiesterase class I)
MTASDSESRRFSGSPGTAEKPVSIDDALRNDWLEIWYQPKIDLKRKCLAGAEALARIRHPQEGVLWPENFLPGADDDALATLTEHALLTTLRNWTSFADAGFNLHLSVNIPASALGKLPIVRLVEENRPQSKHWPGLILEVAEDQIVRDIAQTRKIAAELKAGAITISIDNFGAGYSSFASLRDVPFAEERRHAPARAIHELIGKYEIERLVLLFERSHGAQGNDALHPQRFQPPDVGAKVQL